MVKTLDELERYPWCGHGGLIRKAKDDWQERELVLGFFGAKEKGAVKVYREFMEAGKDQGHMPELVGGGLIRSMGGWSRVLTLRKQGEAESFDDRILGDGVFVQDILTEADQKLARQIRDRKRPGSISQWIKKRCKESGLSEDVLRSGSRRRAVSELRKEICYFLSKELGLPMAEIAREVGVGTTGVAMMIRRKGN